MALARRDPAFRDFLCDETEAEWRAYDSVPLTDDWAEMALASDARRTLARAEIAALEAWRELATTEGT